MWRIYSSIVYEHDLAYVALAAAVCVLSSFTAAGIAQRALGAERLQRLAWLAVGGLVTGAGIWTTHFTAMLGFAREAGLHFDPLAAALSLTLCTLFSTLGWVTGFAQQDRLRGVAAGVLIGAGLGFAHFFDMTALRFAGHLSFDIDLTITSLVGGMSITALAGPLLQRFPHAALAWPTACALVLGTLFLHFVAISGVNLGSTAGAPAAEGLELAEISSGVIAGCLTLIAAALGLAFHGHRVAKLTAADRKELAATVQALRASEADHRAFIDLNPQIQWLADAHGKIIEVGPQWWECADVSPDKPIGEEWFKAIHPDDRAQVRARWRKALNSSDGSQADARYRVRFKDGSYRWFRARARPLLTEAGAVLRWYGSLEDINEQVAAELALRQSEERYRLASEATNDIIWDYDLAQNRATWAGVGQLVLGYPELAHGTTLEWWLERIHPEDRDAAVSEEDGMVRSGRDQSTHEYRFLTAGGDYIWVASRQLLVRDPEGRAMRLVGSMLDITARKQAEAELQQAAFHDPLTGLPNRALYAQRLDAALDQARQRGEMVSLLVLDLNNFKTLNDTLGHAAGDRLLKEIAQRLVSGTPANVTVARLGGDEFAVIAPNAEPEHLHTEVARLRLSALDAPVTIDGLQVAISYCAGGALFPRDAENAAELLQSADLALYAAKAELPGAIKGFRPEMRQASEARAKALSNARRALSDDDIVPFYQPKLCLRTGRLDGFEALLRWHDHAGLQPPASIAAAFEDAELSVELTDRMLDRVLADCVAWRDAGIEVGRMAINLSAADFRRRGLAERVLGRLERAGLPASALELEVTETVLINQLGGYVANALETLQRAGITIALDDFGTGYASLTHLQQFRVDVLKIDRSFVDMIGSAEGRDTAVVNAVLEMSRSMGIRTVAEGIERQEQADYLRMRSCDVGQGYLFSRPIPASRVPGMIEDLEERRWHAAAQADQTAG